MQMYYTNLVENATLTASTEVSGSGTDKLTIRRIGDRFEFGQTGGNIVVDLGSAKNILNIFLDGLDGTWTVEANTSDSWTSPPYSESLEIEEETGWLVLDETYRYWRFVTADDTGAGLMFMCDDYLQMPGINQGSEIYYTTTSSATQSLGMQNYGDEGVQVIDTKFSFGQILEDSSSINGVVVATRKEIISFWKTVENIIPFYVMLWEDSLDEYRPFLGILKDNNIKFKKLKYGKTYSTSLSIMEVK